MEAKSGPYALPFNLTSPVMGRMGLTPDEAMYRNKSKPDELDAHRQVGFGPNAAQRGTGRFTPPNGTAIRAEEPARTPMAASQHPIPGFSITNVQCPHRYSVCHADTTTKVLNPPTGLQTKVCANGRRTRPVSVAASDGGHVSFSRQGYPMGFVSTTAD